MTYSEGVIIGIGNDLLGDDGWGIEVVRELKRKGIDTIFPVVETAEHGLKLLDYLIGYKKAVLVDCIVDSPSGELIEMDILPQRPLHFATLHGIGLYNALFIGREAGIPLPERIKLYGVTVEGVFNVGAKMSEKVAATIPYVVQKIIDDLPFFRGRKQIQRIKRVCRIYEKGNLL
ncbi:MAG: hydrogenase maturation protease [Syntrophorhabdaceae bacterium]|nr:hydrogenase maturation protease [Syntrophorhabdaceae bacterium]